MQIRYNIESSSLYSSDTGTFVVVNKGSLLSGFFTQSEEKPRYKTANSIATLSSE